MTIFGSDKRIILGKPLGAPTPQRPRTDANFVRGEATPGSSYCLEWWGSGGIGYHIFRSKTVSQIREGYLGDLWSGKYADSVQHFTVGDRASKIVDSYRLHGSPYMFYWVLTQEMDGTLSVIDRLTVRQATRKDLRGAFVLEDKPTAMGAVSPSSTSPAVAVAAPVPEPSVVRPVDFIPYEAPAIFQILSNLKDIDHYNVYIGTSLPQPQHCDPLWDEKLLGETGLTGYMLPGNIDTFEDSSTAAGGKLVTVFAVSSDGRVEPCQLGIPADRPPQLVQLA